MVNLDRKRAFGLSHPLNFRLQMRSWPDYRLWEYMVRRRFASEK
jgi:hypothetical protein